MSPGPSPADRKSKESFVTPLRVVTLTDIIVGEVSLVDVCYLLDFHIPVDQ